MKRFAIFFLTILMLVVLAACDEEVCQHRDADDNSLCDKCGESYTDGIDVTPEHTHVIPATWANDATHHWKNCTVCNAEQSKAEHSWDNGVVTTPATTATTGVRTYTCADCGKTKLEEIPLVPHTHVIPATWANDATHHWKNCTVCNAEQSKAEHSWDNGVVTTPATTATTGVRTYTCTVCGKTKFEEIPLIPHTHDYQTVWTSDDNYHWHNCKLCEGIKDKSEHAWGNETITLPATSMKKGLKQFTCITCNKIKIEEIPMLPASNQPLYALTVDKTAYIVMGFDGFVSEITIPNTYNGLRVISIGEKAFKENKNIEKITLPNSIKIIDTSAFEGCTNLKQINIPESVFTIGQGAFRNCTALASVFFETQIEATTISDLVIEAEAFKGCINLATISLAGNTASIGASAFENCYSLKTVYFNDDLEQIGNSAFAQCRVLDGVILNNKLQRIGEFAFDYCVALQSIVIPNSVTSVGKGAFRCDESLVSVRLSSGMQAVSDITFQYCKKLMSVEIPENIKAIGISAFSCCESMTEIRILGDITSFGNQAFYRCENLETLYFGSAAKSSTLYNEHYVFYNAGVNTAGITLTIGQNAYIPEGLFEPLHNQNVPKITTIVIEEGATKIDYFATYHYLPYVRSISIPDSVISINEFAFDGCSSLSYNVKDNGYYLGNSNNPYHALIKVNCVGTAFAVNSGTKILADKAFESCVGLTSITIPLSVTSIGSSAFYGCSSLTSITLPFVGATVDGTSNTHFGYIFGASSYSDNDDYVPTSLKTVVITGGTSIGSSAFRNCSGLTSITIPDGVTSIGSSAFDGCSGLTSITVDSGNTKYHSAGNCLIETASKTLVLGCKNSVIPTDGSVTSIGDHAFYGCSGLTSVTIPDSVTSIGSSAFYGCSGLTSITLPFVGATVDGTSNTHFGYIFGASSYSDNDDYVPTSLKTVVITGGTSIGSSAFRNCSGLTSITIPSSVTTIGSSAFNGCSGLTSITLPFVGATASGTSNMHFGYIFGASSYSYNGDYVPTSLKTVVITGGTSIGSSAFSGCSSLTSITIPASVTSIGSSAFYGCSGLTSVTIPDSVTSIGSSAFYGCSSLTSITIPDSVTSIGSSAFNGCSGLTSITIPDSVTTIGSSAFSGCTNLTIYCEAASKPSGWSSSWNSSNSPVIWGYTGEEYLYNFVTNGGGEIESVTADKAFALPTPTREGYRFIGWYDNAELAGNPVSSPYYSATAHTLYAKWMTEEEYLASHDGSSFEKAYIITSGESLPAVIDTAGEYVYFQFTATEAKTYIFQSSGSYDTYGYLYNSSQAQLTSDDDGGDGNNFSISRSMSAGETVYLKVKMYSSSNTGTFTVSVS